ncbi:MAG TPA: universal stress protein, partial [Polyangiaceae bacterium]|nr:universal stress protein [Polyangiaceae bacterium]
MDGIRNLVVGYDGSRLSEHALRRALELAGQAPFALVHVVVVGREEDGVVTLPQGPVLPRFAALQLLRLTVDRLVRSWRLQRPHVRQVVQLRYGDAARVLVDTAYRYDADLVLVGAHGDALPHTRLGSVAQQVLDHT